MKKTSNRSQALRATIGVAGLLGDLKTTHCIPIALAKSLVDSVLPVPAGPAGEAPSLMFKALVIVIQHLSVSGVMTNLEVAPMYSYP